LGKTVKPNRNCENNMDRFLYTPHNIGKHF